MNRLKDTRLSAEQIETFRQERIEAICNSYGGTPAEIAEKFRPGTLGCHEALYAASLLLDLIDNRLAESPAIALNSEWHSLAVTAQAAVCELYRSIRAAHLGGDNAALENPA